MRVVFAGTPPFAAHALEALAAAGHSIPLVLTQPDRPAGRGMRLAASAVGQTAERLGLPLSKPATLRNAEAVEVIRAARPEVMVVAAYGLILPQAVLDLPEGGCLNIHASLLPRWRGAAPIQRAVLAGDARTGITIMKMDAGLDTGAILSMHEIPIDPRDTTGTLTTKLAGLGAEAIVAALESLARMSPKPQEDAQATCAAKVAKSEARIDWRRSAQEIERAVRAFDPAPGAETRVDAETLKIWNASAIAGGGIPGEVLEAAGDRLIVACGAGALRLDAVQKAGGKRLSAAEYLRGTRLAPGARLT